MMSHLFSDMERVVVLFILFTYSLNIIFTGIIENVNSAMNGWNKINKIYSGVRVMGGAARQ